MSRPLEYHFTFRKGGAKLSSAKREQFGVTPTYGAGNPILSQGKSYLRRTAANSQLAAARLG